MASYDFTAAPGALIHTTADLLEVLAPRRHFLDRHRPIGAFRHDSRRVREGDVFVAIPGKRVDGHRFVDECLAKGAAAALVSTLDGIDNPAGCVLVDDTVNALGFLAAAHRRGLAVKVIGLTGSVGKTTTKDMLHEMLSTGFQTRKSEGNFNSTIGLPLELLKLTERDQWMVAEMGMSTPGEITRLMEMARPDIGLWLSVHAVHQANFADLEGIARAKAELVQALEADKCLVYNLDNPYVYRYSRDYPGRQVTFGLVNADADFQARVERVTDWDGVAFELSTKTDGRFPLWLPLPGVFNVGNALAACAVAVTAGLPPAALASALKRVRPAAGRCLVHRFEPDIRLVDDSYNASPIAVENVLSCFSSLSRRHYRWLVLGDMLELGPAEARIHEDLGQAIAGVGFDRVTLVGPLCGQTFIKLSAQRAKGLHLELFPDSQSAAQALDPTIPGGARVWCKASRGIGLERVVARLHAHLEGKEA